MLFKSKKPEPVPVEQTPAARAAELPKGRPTPKRKEAEQAHARPLVGANSRSNNMTKEEKRAAMRQQRERYAHAMATGDDRYLPARDKGPVKRWVRDYVDSHFWLSEYFLFITLGMLIVLFTIQSMQPAIATFGLLALYLLIFGVIGDTWVRARRMKKELVAKFGEYPKGTVNYGVMRAMQFRRGRQPKPQVHKGQQVK